MQINSGDRIHYNVNYFTPGLPEQIASFPVVDVIVQKTSAGDHEIYVDAAGNTVDELQLVK